jgi:hypothetical protein
MSGCASAQKSAYKYNKMRNTNIRNEFLKALHIVTYATVYNFSPYFNKSAKTISGSLCQARVLFRWAKKQGLIKPIKTIGRDYATMKEQFYCLTRKGADFIDVHDYRNISTKSIHNAVHESAKIDCCLSFIFNYPGYDVKIRYPTTKDHPVKPDAIIKITGNKQYDFLLEVERSREAIQIVNDKIKKYENADFKTYGVSDKTKILFVVSHKRFDPYWRPIKYPQKKAEIAKEQDKVAALVNIVKNKYIKRYRITGLSNYLQIHEAVWFDTHGNLCRLIR